MGHAHGSTQTGAGTAATRSTAAEAPSPERAQRRGALAWLRRYRLAATATYVAAWALGWTLSGGVDRPSLLVFVIGLVLVTCLGDPRPVPSLLVAWLPLVVILAAYDVIRAQADSLLPRAHLEPQLAIDEWLGGGTAPSVRLQRWLFTPHALEWYDFAAFVVYLTHFVVPIVVAAVLWFKARAQFARFAWMILGLTLAGFSTYVLYPAIPPWLASERGALPAVVRAVPIIWRDLGIGALAKVFSGNPEYSNPVGALPSEHAAYPLLIMLFFWGLTNRRWVRALLVAYTLAMAFVLVYLGEHYVADVLLGWVYATVVYFGVDAIFRYRARRRAAVDLRADADVTTGS